MKTLEQLIRLNRHRLTERQKALVALEAKGAHLRQEAEELEARALIEEATAEQSALGTFAWGAYLARVKAERERLAATRAELAGRIEEARAKLKAAFEELKRIEILRDQKIAAAKAEAKKREQQALDEVAMTQHHRREA